MFQKCSDSEVIVAKLFVRNNWRDVSTFKGDELSSNKIVINFDGNEKTIGPQVFDFLRTTSYQQHCAKRKPAGI